MVRLIASILACLLSTAKAQPLRALLPAEPPRIERINVFPLIELEAAELSAACPLKTGDRFDEATAVKAVQALDAETARLGYPGSKTMLRYTRLTSTTLAVGFVIEPPEPAELHRVRFKGAGWGNAPRIRKYFKELEPLPFDRGSSVTAARLREVETISLEIMRSLGHLEAEVRLAETKRGDRGVTVEYQIERGPRFRIDEAIVDSRRFPDPDHWEMVVDRFEGKPFTASRLKELEDGLKLQSRRDGYMAPEIELEFTPSPEEHRVIVQAAVDEGTTSVLGSVVIEREEPERGHGTSWYHRRIAPPMAERLIRRQIRAQMGEPLNEKVIEDASRQLWRLGNLDEVEVETSATSDTYVRDLAARVRDRRTASIGASFGWVDELGPVGQFSLSETNLGGLGDALGLQMAWHGEGLSGEVSYLDRHWRTGERWLGEDRDPSLLWNATLTQRAYDEYVEQRAGGGLSLRYLVGDRGGLWSNAWQARVEQVGYDPFDDEVEYREDFNTYIAATLGYRLLYDGRDRGDWDATRGLLFETGLEAGAADGPLVKWTTRGEWRYPLMRRLTWVVQGEAGVMPVDASKVGLSHRYHGGGLEGVRGFEERGLGPVDDRNDDLHIGGSTSLVLRNEVRYLFNDRLQFPVFVDVGALDDGAFSIGKPRASVGLGLRFVMPGSNQRAYVYFAENVLAEDTDNERTIRFGFSFGL